MASSSDKIFGITTAAITIPVGATLAVLVTPGPGVQVTQLLYVSGGSVCIFGNPQLAAGATSSIATTFSTLGISALVQGFSNGYPIGLAPVSINGPAEFYMATIGNTAVVSVMQGLSTLLPSFN